MDRTQHFERNRGILEDFTSRSLSSIPSHYGRLLYISSLRDAATGAYEHDGLAAIYPSAAVQQALACCHEELFHRILELSMQEQESDLADCLDSFEVEAEDISARWLELEFYRLLVPLGSPAYLRRLFASNVRVLLRMREAGTARAAA